jgi:2-polyprenyl-3-methyl-5-hydroxy-6-metoxy-1,4-benzoquinol methylase
VKGVVKRVARSLGYEIRKIQPGSSAWPPPDNAPPEDEVIRGPWISHVLRMANRYYQPPTLRYSKYGEDQRIKYVAYFLDLRGLRTLEIGPLEGAHSVLLEKMSVRENVAIESREENLRKCKRVKEKYRLDHTTFLQHDLEQLYSGQEKPQFDGPFDLVFCLGVLYHVPEPAKALAWFRSQANTLFLGTHYISEPREQADVTYLRNGKSYRVKEWREGGLLDLTSGMSPVSLVPYEADLIEMIKDAGYSRISVLGKDYLQNATPHITILAE